VRTLAQCIPWLFIVSLTIATDCSTLNLNLILTLTPKLSRNPSDPMGRKLYPHIYKKSPNVGIQSGFGPHHDVYTHDVYTHDCCLKISYKAVVTVRIRVIYRPSKFVRRPDIDAEYLSGSRGMAVPWPRRKSWTKHQEKSKKLKLKFKSTQSECYSSNKRENNQNLK